jgi:uncharacterized protein YndB with AHSA1/START domain
VIEARQSFEIARSPEDVFAFVTDPAKLSRWQDAAVMQLTPGPLGAGTRLREVHKVLGRRREEITEVVAFEPPRLFAMRVVDGPPVDGRWEFAPAGTGTRVTFTPTVRLRPRLRQAEPLVALATVLVFKRFHRRLKRVLEAGEGS